MATVIKEDIGLDIGTALIFVIYSALILVIGIWGYTILPSKCTNHEIRSSLRTVIISGAVTATAFFGYGICASTCRKQIDDKEDGVFLNTSHTTPSWLLTLVLIVSLVSLTNVAGAIKKIDDNKNTCQTGKYDTWKKAANLLIVIHSIVSIVIVGILGYRLYKRTNKKRKKKRKRIDKIMRGVNPLSEEDDDD